MWHNTSYILTDRQFNTFKTMTEEDVKVTITNAPLKHCELIKSQQHYSDK